MKNVNTAISKFIPVFSINNIFGFLVHNSDLNEMKVFDDPIQKKNLI